MRNVELSRYARFLSEEFHILNFSSPEATIPHSSFLILNSSSPQVIIQHSSFNIPNLSQRIVLEGIEYC